MNWQKLGSVKLPEFTIGNITQYFITRITEYDSKPSSDHKNLNKHAFPLFKAGHVQNIEVAMDSKYCNCKCICLPEMKKGNSVQHKVING